MACVTTPNFAILINGSPTSFFRSSRGLRQGCPLSPLLFLLIIEGLNKLIIKAREDGLFTCIKFSEKLLITHLLFVDDVILFGLDNIYEWKTMLSLLVVFCNDSSMDISSEKSCIYTHNIRQECLNELNDHF